MDYRKIANIFKKSRDFIIWRKSEDEYWLTDIYFLIKLDRQTFCKVKAKYSSYVRMPYIEELKIGDKVRYDSYRSGFFETEINIERVMDDSKVKDAELTRFNLDDLDKGLLSIIVGDGFLTCVDKKYIELFGYDKEYKCADINSIIFVYKKSDLIGLVMPIRYNELEDWFKPLRKVMCNETNND